MPRSGDQDVGFSQTSGSGSGLRCTKPKPSDLPELALDFSRGAGHVMLPAVKIPREEQQRPYVRQIEIDPNKYYPADGDR